MLCSFCPRRGWGREGVGVNPDLLGAVGFDDRGIGFDPARADQIKAVGNGGEDSLKAGADGVGAAWGGGGEGGATRGGGGVGAGAGAGARGGGGPPRALRRGGGNGPGAA